jgi:diguanylate cyclase (GGDEF)-like protein
LADLRTSLKSVLAKMTQDVDTLMTLSRQDGLTGLANRRSFDEFLQKAVASWEDDGIPISLIMLDIDYFKKVNDTFGHRTGDQVLQALAKQVTKIIHPLITNDDKALVARYGGEEFGIVLCGSLAPRAVVLAEVIRKTASKIVVIPPEEESGDDKEKLALTVSLGVATVCVWEGWKGAYQSNIVDFADKALYQAKSGGRNCTVQYLPESDEPYKVVPSN